MSNILFLTSQYSGVASANGICTKNIVTELEKKGHVVSVVCYENGVYEENVYTIPICEKKGKSEIISKIGKTIRSFFLPIIDKDKEAKFKEKTLTLCEEKNIDIVVSVFFPRETVSVMKSVKDKFPNVKTIAYELDSIGDGIFASSKIYFLATRAYERWQSENYCYADKIIVMKSHEDYWKRVFGEKYGKKLLISDIPVLVESSLPDVKKEFSSQVSFLYGGLLNKKYRSPNYLLTVFDAFSKKTPASIDFYSKGDCEDSILAYARKNSCIKQHGYVSTEELNIAIAQADVLISIGNRVSNSVPSKLITYLSYGKPVIHFSSQKNDVCEPYIEKYPSGLVLYEWDSVEENLKKLHKFLNKSPFEDVEFSNIVDVLQTNTPSYSVDLIECVIVN